MSYPPFHPATTGSAPTDMPLAAFRQAFPTEGDYAEFKAGFSTSAVQESVVAFSNADGGVILLGVNDSGEIVGKESTPGLTNSIHQLFTDVRNPARYEIFPLAVDGTGITVISVARRTQGFAQTSDGRVLVRRGAHNRALFGEELLRFASQRSLERFEETDSGISLSEVSEMAITDLAQVFDWADPESWTDRLIENSLVIRAEHGFHLTVARALFLLADASVRLGKTYVDVLRFADGATDYDKRVSFTGPVQGQIEVTVDRIMDELGTEPVTVGVQRFELPKLPRVVLREGISNAVAHRSYQMNGTAIRVEIRKDAVKIISPGGLPEPVTVKNIREAQCARNPEILRMLRRYGLAEDAGRGVDVMQDEMAGALLDPPQFADTGHTVEVVLPVHGPVSALERAWVMDLERRQPIDPKDRVLVVQAGRGTILTNSRVREALGIDRFEAMERLQRLRDAGLLAQSGERGGASYRLAPGVIPPSGVRVSQAELDDAVCELARRVQLNNRRVREATGLDRIEALALLKRLVREGKLVARGQKRGTFYKAAGKRWVTKKSSR